MQRAHLTIVQTSPACLSYRLVVDGRTIWSNRVVPTPEGDAGARSRLAAWAATHGYEVIERKEVVRKRA